MSTWRSTRKAIAASAILMAALTGALEVWLGGSGWHVFGACIYVLMALASLLSPPAIAVLVVWGQILVGSLLMAQEGPNALFLVPLIAGIIVTAELLAVVARLDTPLDSDPREDLPRAGTSALIGGGIFGAMALVGGLPGPTGPFAVVAAAGACVVLATLLVRADPPDRSALK